MGLEPIRVDELTDRIRVEYQTMPGLRLTIAQAQRLWGLDRHACHAVLTVLIETKFLRRTKDGRFVRADVGELPSASSFGSVA